MFNIGYARVSTREQAENGYSLTNQENSINKYFINKKIKNTKILIDDGYSAKNLKRPGMQEIINLIKYKKVKTLVVTKIDRLSREVSDYSYLINLCIENRVEIISLNENIDISNASGRVANYIKSSFAHYERELISERTIDGYYGKAIRGEYPYAGCPLGFDKTENHQLVVNDEIEIVKAIFKIYQNTYDIDSTKIIINAKYQKDFSFDKIKRVLDNTIYFGYKIIKGEKIYLVEPIIEETDFVDIKAKLSNYNKSTRYTHKHIGKYKYYNKVYFEDRIMRHLTKRKKGRVYKYYYDRKSKTYINEKTLDEFLFNYKYKCKFKYLSDIVNQFIATNDTDQLLECLEEYKQKFKTKEIEKIEVLSKEMFKVYYK